MRQWARTVLIVERGIPPNERLRQQNLYCDINRYNINKHGKCFATFKCSIYVYSNGDKALVMKQFLSDEKVEEINEIIAEKEAKVGIIYLLFFYWFN